MVSVNSTTSQINTVSNAVPVNDVASAKVDVGDDGVTEVEVIDGLTESQTGVKDWLNRFFINVGEYYATFGCAHPDEKGKGIGGIAYGVAKTLSE